MLKMKSYRVEMMNCTVFRVRRTNQARQCQKASFTIVSDTYYYYICIVINMYASQFAYDLIMAHESTFCSMHRSVTAQAVLVVSIKRESNCTYVKVVASSLYHEENETLSGDCSRRAIRGAKITQGSRCRAKHP